MFMKAKKALLIISIAVAGAAAFACSSHDSRPAANTNAAHSSEHPSPAAQDKSVPAHYQTEPARISLAPTLDPEGFTGKTKEAYRVVRENPQLIAQLPCYCYCDRGFGHKSLQSCYVDDHAAHCAVCVDEVLIAYDLQKQGLSAQQIREKLVAQYGG
jgi:uncharacterized protein with PCYCGC motif